MLYSGICLCMYLILTFADMSLCLYNFVFASTENHVMDLCGDFNYVSLLAPITAAVGAFNMDL